MHSIRTLSLLTLFSLASAWADDSSIRPKSERFDDDIDKFLAEDAKKTPAKDSILFIGSSSIRKWDTKQFFPKLPTINRGFGGSWTQDSVHYLEKIVFPYAPRTIVLYEGDNDIGGGLNAEAVFQDYVTFAKAVHTKLPKTNIIFVAIKPSIKRWSLWSKMQKANDLVVKRCESEPLERFLDIAPLLLGADGKPDARFFAKDGLHLSKEGYQRWSDLLRPLLASVNAKSS